MSIERIDPGRRFAQAVVHGDTVYLAGHTASDAGAGVYEQTVEIRAAMKDTSRRPAPKVELLWRRSGSPTSPRSTR